MRTLSATLLAEQKKQLGLNPLTKLVLTHGATTYTYLKDRIRAIEHDETPYSHKATLVLDNTDGALNSLDFKGYEASLSYGLVTSAGEEYSATPLLYVIGQEFTSRPGLLQCELSLMGVPDMLAADRAHCAYIPDEDSEYYNYAVGTLLTQILQPSDAHFSQCFSHCRDYNLHWDTTDTLMTTYLPKGDFRVFYNSSRLAVIRRLLDLTQAVMQFKEDGSIQVYDINQSSYDYEYEMQPGSHTFLAKAYRNRMVIPNYVVVQSHPDDSPKYLGHNTDASYSIIEKRAYKYATLASNAEGNELAHSVILKAQLAAHGGYGVVPLNLGQEIYDYVQITDKRSGDTAAGNVGYIHRKVNLAKKQWEMTFGFGNWASPQSLLNALEMETATHDTALQELAVGDVYAYNIHTAGQVFGDLNLQDTYKVTKLYPPSADQDAATKKYVDDKAYLWYPTNYASTSKIVNTPYLNDSGKLLIVIVTLDITTGTGGSARAAAYIGPANPPIDKVDDAEIVFSAGDGNSSIEEFRTLKFLVPPGYYYEVQTWTDGYGEIAKVSWNELY